MSGQKWQGSDPALGLLLDAHGEIFKLQGGYWIKFEVWLIEPRPEIPHGIRYSLTMHDRHGTRMLGFDNAHGLRMRQVRFGPRVVVWDHIHSGRKLLPYQFQSAGQLMVDFWWAVNKYLKDKG